MFVKRYAWMLLALLAVLAAEVCTASPTDAAARIFRARMNLHRRNRRNDDTRSVAWRMANAALAQHEQNFLSVPSHAPDRHPIAHLTNHLANNNRRIPVLKADGAPRNVSSIPPMDFTDIGNYHSEHGNKGRGHQSHEQLTVSIGQVVQHLWAVSQGLSHLERVKQTAVQLYRWFDVEGHALGRGRAGADAFWFDIVHEETGVDIVNTLGRQRLSKDIKTPNPFQTTLSGKRPSRQPSEQDTELSGLLGLLPTYCFLMPSAASCQAATALRHHPRLVSAVSDQWATRITPVRPGSPLGPPIKVFTKEEGADIVVNFFAAVASQLGSDKWADGKNVSTSVSSLTGKVSLAMQCGDPTLAFPLVFGATPSAKAITCVRGKENATEALWKGSSLHTPWPGNLPFPLFNALRAPNELIADAEYASLNTPWLRSPFTERLNGDELRNRHVPIPVSPPSRALDRRKSRILCATYTFHKKVHKATMMHMFWGHECDTHILFTDKEIEPKVFEITFGIFQKGDKEEILKHQRGGGSFRFGRMRAVVGIPKYGENYMNMWQKTRMILARVEEIIRGTKSLKVSTNSVPVYMPQFEPMKNPPWPLAPNQTISTDIELFMDFDYILLGGDDVCFSPDAFRILAGHLEKQTGAVVGESAVGGRHIASTVPIHIGYAHRHFIAGAAYVMNDLGYKAFMQSGYPNYEPNGKTFAEDVLIGSAHTTVGTVPRNANSPSGSGEDIFACASQAYPSGMAMNVDSTNWMREYKRRVMPRGATCIGRDLVQTHFCTPVEMGNMKAAEYAIPDL